MLCFDFTIAQVPVKLLTIADTLSRAPINSPTGADQELIEETGYFVCAIIDCLLVSEE